MSWIVFNLTRIASIGQQSNIKSSKKGKRLSRIAATVFLSVLSSIRQELLYLGSNKIWIFSGTGKEVLLSYKIHKQASMFTVSCIFGRLDTLKIGCASVPGLTLSARLLSRVIKFIRGPNRPNLQCLVFQVPEAMMQIQVKPIWARLWARSDWRQTSD